MWDAHLTDPLEPGHELVASLVHGVRDVVRQPRHLHSVQYSVLQYSTVNSTASAPGPRTGGCGGWSPASSGRAAPAQPRTGGGGIT